MKTPHRRASRPPAHALPAAHAMPTPLLPALSSTRRAALLAGGLLCLPLAWAQAADAPSPGGPPQYGVRDFFSNPPQSSYRLSDDGRWLSYMAPAPGDGGPSPRRNLFVQALDGSTRVGAPRQLTRESARDIGAYQWKGSQTLIYQKDFGGDENFHVVSVNVATGKVTDLTPHEKTRAELVDELPDDPAHILVGHNRRDPQVMDLYRINVITGQETLVAKNPGNIVGWTSDNTGRVRLAVASDGVNNTLLYRPDDQADFKPLFSTDFRTQVGPVFFEAGDKRFYALSNRGRDRSAAVLIDPAAPADEQVVYEHPKVDLLALGQSRTRKVLTLAEFAEAKADRKVFDAATEAVFNRLHQQLPAYEVTVQSSNRDETLFVVAAYNDRTEGARYLYDLKSDRLAKLGEINPKLPERHMAAMQPVTYTARDGLEIPAYLTLPPGRPAKNLACVVNPHGGPWARDLWGFNPEVQFLANRGFCVLQMNFRGSTGYGRKFWEASFGQWGLKMQDDISDGVKWLVAQGIADPRRIGIYGGSYGGYATLAGLTFTPELYAAGVDYVGVSNMFTFMKTIPPYWEPLRQQFYAMVGNPDDPKDKERLTATSPVFHVDRIRAPLFIAQGAQDPRVNKAESDQVVEALKKRGVEVRYMVKDNEGHGFHNEENKYEFYEAMEAFFRQHLKP